MIPDRPAFPRRSGPNKEVAADLSNMIETVTEPEAEISLIEGQTKVIQSRRELTRIVVSNPLIADVELLNDQPNSRLVNLYGKSFGTTSLTMWDQTNRPVSFLVRVTLDTKDLGSRIRQAFPGADVKVRQVGPQIILDGQVPDSKTMSDIDSACLIHAHEQPVASRHRRRGNGRRRNGNGWRRRHGWRGNGRRRDGRRHGRHGRAGIDDAHQSHLPSRDPGKCCCTSRSPRSIEVRLARWA